MLFLERIFFEPIKTLLAKTGINSDLILASIGVLCVLAIYLLSLIIKKKNPTEKFNQQLLEATDFLVSGENITEENAEQLNDRIKLMPESVQKGWGCFLEQRNGYPSDFISLNDTIHDKKTNKKDRTGIVFLNFFSIIVIVFTIWMEYMLNKNASLSTLGLVDFTENFILIAAIIATFCAPLLAFVVFRILLNIGYNKQYKTLIQNFTQFQNVLDSKVLIYNGPEEEDFVSENRTQIDAAIAELMAKDAEEKRLIEIVTVKNGVYIIPKIELIEDKRPVEDMGEGDPINESVFEVPIGKEEVSGEMDGENSTSAEPIGEEKVLEPIEEDGVLEELIDEETVSEEMEEDASTNVESPEEEKVLEPTGDEEIPEEADVDNQVNEPASEEKQRRLEGLIAIIDQAVFHDPNITPNQVEELAIMIESERLYGMHHERDKEILEECLKKLAEKHTSLSVA